MRKHPNALLDGAATERHNFMFPVDRCDHICWSDEVRSASSLNLRLKLLQRGQGLIDWMRATSCGLIGSMTANALALFKKIHAM